MKNIIRVLKMLMLNKPIEVKEITEVKDGIRYQ